MFAGALPLPTDADRPQLDQLFVELRISTGLCTDFCISLKAHSRQVSLVDFGATREYTKEFMDDWLHLLQAAASKDRDACAEWSLKLGYLTGKENEVCAGFF